MTGKTLVITFKDLKGGMWEADATRKDNGDFWVAGREPVDEDDRDVVQGGFAGGIKSVMEREEEAEA